MNAIILEFSSVLKFPTNVLQLLAPQRHLNPSIIAFACNAKRFAIDIVFFLFLIPSTVFGRTGKSFFSVFNPSLSRTRVTSIGPVSLATLANVFVFVQFTVMVWVSGMGGQ